MAHMLLNILYQTLDTIEEWEHEQLRAVFQATVCCKDSGSPFCGGVGEFFLPRSFCPFISVYDLML
jgi:hypothetical protein